MYRIKEVMKNRLFLFILSFVLFFSNITYSQVLNRHVVGAGGRTIESNGIRINCTIGQTHIGLLKPAAENIIHGVGYWYSAGYIMNNPSSVSVVMIPNLSAEIGTHVTVPLILKESRYNDMINPRNFTAKIRYNMTVLQPVGKSPKCNVSNNDDCIVTVEGTMPDSAGVMANIDFLVRLGSVDNSPLVIDTFYWNGNNDVLILKQDGDIEVLGICKEGDTIRTVKKSVIAGLQASYPDPANDQTLINYSLSENGFTKISLSNNLGREILVVFEGDAQSGKHSTLVDLTNISSGLYYINLITPTERFSRKLLIQK